MSLRGGDLSDQRLNHGFGPLLFFIEPLHVVLDPLHSLVGLFMWLCRSRIFESKRARTLPSAT